MMKLESLVAVFCTPKIMSILLRAMKFKFPLFQSFVKILSLEVTKRIKEHLIMFSIVPSHVLPWRLFRSLEF